MEELRYYRTLGLPADADIGQIKSAYRVLAKKYHPDMSKDPSTGEQFRRVVAAHKTLVAREEKKSFIQSTVHRSYRAASTTATRATGTRSTGTRSSQKSSAKTGAGEGAAADQKAGTTAYAKTGGKTGGKTGAHAGRKTGAHGEDSKSSLFSIGQLLLHGKTSAMRVFAAKRLGLTKHKGAYVYLRKALHDPSETVVLAVIEAIGRLQISISSKDLETVFDNGSLTVKMAVLQAIEMCGRNSVFLGILVKGMQSLDRKVRSKSISLFAHAGKRKGR